jgi:hypothetical protein
MDPISFLKLTIGKILLHTVFRYLSRTDPAPLRGHCLVPALASTPVCPLIPSVLLLAGGAVDDERTMRHDVTELSLWVLAVQTRYFRGAGLRRRRDAVQC